MNIISLVFHQHRKPFLAMFALTLLSGLLGIGVLVFYQQLPAAKR
jgi:ABC-type siderophore export system fused ATPase/permease subunit